MSSSRNIAPLLRALLALVLGLALAQPGIAQGPYEPGSALRFDGVARQVNVLHNAALNSFPLTVSVWIRTTTVSANVDGVVSKYADGTPNGWSLFLSGGRLYAWYSISTVRQVFTLPWGLQSGFVADGNWHHVVFTVGLSGGRLYVDGVSQASLPWTGLPGAVTTLEPVRIGRYFNYPTSLVGDIDEITIWSRELDANYVRMLGHRGPIGTESGLVASWRVDNGAGTVLSDSTAAARNGTLSNSPAWVTSDAPVRRADPAGDAWWNVLGRIATATFSRTWIITDAPEPTAPELNATGTLIRLDDLNLPITPVDVPVSYTVAITDAADNSAVPLAQDSFPQSINIDSRTTPVAIPTLRAVTAALPLEPVGGLSGFLPGHSYRATVTLSYEESDGSVHDGGSLTTAPANFTVLSGHLMFGGIETRFSQLSSAPAAVPGGNVTLVIPAGSGWVDGFPASQFGGTFVVSVDPVTHHATVVSGSASVTRPAVDTETITGLKIRRGTITLSSAGATAGVTVYFPTGFGYTAEAGSRLLEPSLTAVSRALTQQLRPADPVFTLTAPGGLFVCEESKPILIKAGGIQCDLSAGIVRATALVSAQSVRQKEIADLAAASGLAAGSSKKASNDGWLETAATIAGPVEVRVGPRGDARLTTGVVGATAVTFTTHHPAGVQISTAGAQLFISDDQCTAASSIALAGSVTVPQGRDCPECVGIAGAGARILVFNAVSAVLRTTPDGGLIGSGTLAAPTDIQWGFGPRGYAQTVHGVTSGSVMIPGFAMNGGETARSPNDKPGVLLNSGSSAMPDAGTGVYPAERPDTAGYAAGTGSYAGFNFSVPADGALLASCRLGDQLFASKPLRACCKYYARAGGVSGLHQVLRGSIAGVFVVDGYKLQIDRYRLSFLSSQNTDSGINGAVFVGGYSRFQQDFEKLSLTCLGGLKALQLPAVPVKKRLYYWNAEVRPLTMEFVRPNECLPGTPGDTILIMGCEAWVSHVQPVIAARLAINSQGCLLPKSELAAYAAKFPDLDSVLHLPGIVPVRGPQGSTYTLVPVTPAYFSAPTDPPPADANPSPPNGFLHFAARMDVSFFDDLQVHVQTIGNQDGIADPLHFMGGWADGTGSYFTNPDFDPARRGLPLNVSKEAYRANNDPAWLVKANCNWKGIVKMDNCPLKWNQGARLFTAFAPCTTSLPIFTVETRVNALGPKKADLRFAKDILPNFSLGNIAINELTEATGVMTAFQNAGQGAGRALLQQGMESLESMLANDINALVAVPLNRAIDPFTDLVMAQVQTGLNTTVSSTALAAQFTSAFNNFNAPGAGGVPALSQAVVDAMSAAGDAQSMIAQIRQRIVTGRAAVAAMRDILQKNPGSGKRDVLPGLAEKLLEQFGSPVLAQLGGAAVRESLNVQIDELEDAFSSLDASFAELDGVFARLLASLDAAGSFAVEVKTRLDGVQLPITTAIAAAGTQIAAQFQSYNVAGMNLGTAAAQDRLKQEMRRILRDRLLGSKLTSEMQRMLRERLADVNDALGGAIDSVFQQINDTVRSAIVKAAAGLSSEFTKFAGSGAQSIADTGAVAKINGHAVILGDKLNYLRIDGEFKLSFGGENGAEFGLMAFLEVKDVSSRGGPGCGASPGKELTEITIGAEDVRIGWKAGPNLTADLGVKFTLEGTPTAAYPVNFGGYIKVTGGLDFAVLKIKELALAVAVGTKEFYVSAGARVEVSGWEFAGGFFAGKACTLEPIELWAPDARQVIGRDPGAPDQSFLGVYFYAEGWIPLNELLGIPSSCVLTIKVGAGMGFFVNLAGAEPEIGAKFLLGLDGEVICLLGIHAEFILRGRKRGLDFSTDGLRMVGEGSLCLEIGPCPFCVEICATLVLIYDGGSWNYEL